MSKKRLGYWENRELVARRKKADKTIEAIDKQLAKYYKKAFNNAIREFEATYDKYLLAIADGREASPATLYSLDKYWQMQAQLKRELQKLGDKEVALLSKEFEKEWITVYESIALPSESAFATISTPNAKQMINTAWLADGKNFSQRVWDNVDKLVTTLNDELISCVVAGKTTRDLKQKLIERFNVSYNKADTLVRTEIAHIQVEASAQRYKDYGYTKYKFFADEDKRTCKVCGALDGKVFKFTEMQAGVNSVPMHPSCRCDILPVIE